IPHSTAASRRRSLPGIHIIEEDPATLSHQGAARLAATLQQALHLPIVFPPGTTGYGFLMGTTKFIILEDWKEDGRETVLLVEAHPSSKSARACDVNEHRKLDV